MRNRIIAGSLALLIMGALVGLVFALTSCASGSREPEGQAETTFQPLKFDAGTDSSPLKPGYLLLGRDIVYSKATSYGWDSPLSDAFHRTKVSKKITEEAPDPLLVDGLRDVGPRTFRANVPNGSYWVVVYLGDLGGEQIWKNKVGNWPGGPVFSMKLSANGQTVASDANAYTSANRGDQTTYVGGATRLAFPVSVTDNELSLTFGGDDSAYRWRAEADSRRELMDIEKEMQRSDPNFKAMPKRWLGGPYEGFSLLGIEIWPGFQMQLRKEGGKLLAVTKDADPNLLAGIEQFNAGQLDKARASLGMVDSQKFGREKAMALMFLAGHEQIDQEEELISEAKRILSDLLAGGYQCPCATELLRQATDFGEGVLNFGRMGYHGESAAENMFRAEAFFRQIPKDSPLYGKAQVYRGRIYGALDPNRVTWMWTEARTIFKELEPLIPTSRYVKFYLSKEALGPVARREGFKAEDDIRAAGTGDWRDDWYVPTYTSDLEGAPTWAANLRESYRRLLDLSDWWIENRQIENGEIGGGYGDDVEVVFLWGYAAFINKLAAPKTHGGAKLLVDGIWNAPEMDQEKGYFRGTVGWVKIPAEYTGYSQPLMAALEYGNPIYYERLLKVAKHIRDFGTVLNANGRRHFRSGYFNAYRHSPDPLQEVDTALAWRCMLPASWLSWYSGNEAAEQLMDEWAESWLHAAMSTEAGKPAGVIPSMISSRNDKVGPPNSPNWYDIVPPNMQGDYEWPQYTRYLYSLMSNVYARKKDPRFLAPLDATIELARAGKGKDPRNLERGSRGWVEAVCSKMAPTYAEQAAMNLRKMAGLSQYDGFISEYSSGWERYCTTGDWRHIEEVLSGMNNKLRDCWPIMTTELAMTDRIGIYGMVDVVSCYVGGFGSTYDGFPAFSASYETDTRDFAALVRESTPDVLKVLLYSFLERPGEIDIHPWILPGRTALEVRSGSDVNGDGDIDEVLLSRQFRQEHRGDAVRVPLPPRKLCVVEIKRTGDAPAALPLADLAVAPDDISYEGFAEPSILVTVHNIGAAPAKEVKVEVYEREVAPERKIGESRIGHIGAPNDLDAQSVRVGILFRPMSSEQEIVVVLDPADEMAEITGVNNRASRRLRFTTEQIEAAKPVALEPPPSGGRR